MAGFLILAGIAGVVWFVWGAYGLLILLAVLVALGVLAWTLGWEEDESDPKGDDETFSDRQQHEKNHTDLRSVEIVSDHQPAERRPGHRPVPFTPAKDPIVTRPVRDSSRDVAGNCRSCGHRAIPGDTVCYYCQP